MGLCNVAFMQYFQNIIAILENTVSGERILLPRASENHFMLQKFVIGLARIKKIYKHSALEIALDFKLANT